MSPSSRSRLYLAIIAALVLVIAAMVWQFMIAGSVRPAEDGRVVVQLESGERALVLAEMRGFVAGLQRISQALAEEDMKTVAEVARSLGAGKAHDVPPALIGKLPLEFKRLAFGVHEGFDTIAEDASSGATPKQVLGRLSGALQGCVACHARYQFAGVPAP